MFIVKTIKEIILKALHLCCIRIHVEHSVHREDQTFSLLSHIKVKYIYFVSGLRRFLVEWFIACVRNSYVFNYGGFM